jgi:hypothetical protein
MGSPWKSISCGLKAIPSGRSKLSIETGACTVWEDTFATEQDALNEVFQTIAADGMSSFLRQPDRKLH